MLIDFRGRERRFSARDPNLYSRSLSGTRERIGSCVSAVQLSAMSTRPEQPMAPPFHRPARLQTRSSSLPSSALGAFFFPGTERKGLQWVGSRLAHSRRGSTGTSRCGGGTARRVCALSEAPRAMARTVWTAAVSGHVEFECAGMHVGREKEPNGRGLKSLASG